MIDIKTGKIIFDDIEINKHMRIEDFFKYDKSKVKINDRGNGRGVITLKNEIISNGVSSQIKIEINEKTGSTRINIFPSLKESNELDLVSASKSWLTGIIPLTELTIKEKSITGEYSWGHVSIQYLEDREYGIAGGDINIVYNI